MSQNTTSSKDGGRRPGLFALPLGTVVATVALLASILTVSAPSVDAASAAPTPSASPTAVASDFDPGYIVSDENFYDGAVMDGYAVQDFILSKNSRCTSTYACLWGYAQATPATAASRYCSAIPAFPIALAATIIAEVGRACNINQRALLVLLEKEQTLVSSASPTQRSFEAATGFGCPDTAPCDPAFGSFFYQVYNAARQFQVYKANPTSFNHRPNATNTVRYHPVASCGSSPVYIRNAATAGLYNYTPYQPNAAALQNLYGRGDDCSAYGNRNFWRLWTDWFGSPTADGYDLIRLAGTEQIYLVHGNQRYAFWSKEMLAQYAVLGAVREVSAAVFTSRWVDGYPVQRAVRASDGAIYLIDDGKRYRFSSCAQVVDFGQSCDRIPTVATGQVNRIPDAGSLSSLVGMADGTKWLMQGGQRRLVPDASVLAPYGISPVPTKLSYFSTAENPIGAPALKAGLYTDGQGRLRTATGAGNYDVSVAAAAGGLTVQPVRIDPYSFAAMTPAGTLPLKLVSDGRYFVAAAGGWFEVAGAVYGSALFTSLGSGAWQGLPVVGVEKGPHFIRERSSSQVYLVSGGLRSPVANEAELDAISVRYGVSKRLWVAADGVLADLGEQSNLPAGSLVAAKGGPTYLVDSGRLVRVPRSDYVAQLGLGTAVKTVTTNVVNGFTDRSAVLDRTIVRCAGVDFVGSNGGRHPFASGVAADWNMAGIPLSAATCALIPQRSPAVGRYLVGPDGRHWWADAGAHLQILDGTARTLLAGISAPVSVSNEAVGQLAGGLDITTGARQGALVLSPQGVVYLVDGARLTQMTRWETAADLGLGSYATTTRVDAGLIAAFPAPTAAVLDRPVVRCGTTDYVGVRGALTPFASAAVAREWALTGMTLSSAACSSLRVSNVPLTQFFRTPDGTVWTASAGQRRAIYGWPAMDRLKVIATGYTDVSDEVARLLRVGQPITN